MKNFTRNIITGIALCFALTSADAQYVTIPDANFRTWLNTHGYASCMNGNQMDTTCSAVVNATVVSISPFGPHIQNLTGISYFDNLTSLSISSNGLTLLPTLPATLTTLDCSQNTLSSLPTLPTTLTYLSCRSNWLSSLPALPSTLKNLDLSGNQFLALPTLPVSLTNLDCSWNYLTSLPPLPDSLIVLGCQFNQYLNSLPSLPSSLTNLFCNNIQLTSLPALPASLKRLDCYYNQLTSLPLLPAKLNKLNCYNNQLITLPALPDTMSFLQINNNPGLTCLPTIHVITDAFSWGNTGINCLPNAINVTGVSTPTIVGVPICSTPSQPSSITGNIAVCAGSSQTYSVASVPNANSYTWSLPPGWVGTSATNSINITAGSAGGSISVTANGKCVASSAPSSLAVTVNVQQSAPTSISVSGGAAKVCPGDTRTYTTPLVAGVTYNWTVPTGAVLNSGQGTRTINVTYNSGFTGNGVLSVSKVQGCGVSAPKTLNINRNVPATPSAITGTNYGLCGATNKTYSVTPVAGMTYQWTVPAVANIVSGQGTNSITVNFPSSNFTGTVSVKAVNACGPGAARNLTVRAIPSTPLSITGPITACANQQNVAYSTAAVASATSYTWGVPSGASITSGQGTTSIVMKYGTASGNVRVRAVNACGNSGYRNLAITINCREGAENFHPLQDVLIYPSPSQNVFTINVSNSNQNNYSLIVRDMIGRTVYEQSTILTDEPFDFGAELSSGLYFAEIQQGDERKIVRLIKSN